MTWMRPSIAAASYQMTGVPYLVLSVLFEQNLGLLLCVSPYISFFWVGEDALDAAWKIPL